MTGYVVLWLGRTEIDENAAAIVAEGLHPLMPVALRDSWMRADQLRAGDQVLTFDGDPVPIVSVHLHRLDAAAPLCARPLHVPPGALGNAAPAILPPEQVVMLECDLAAQMYGEPFVTLPASALEGWRGIHRIAPPGQAFVRLTFDLPTLIHTDGDMVLCCPGLPSFTGMPRHGAAPIPSLGPTAARHLVSCLKWTEAQEALRLGA